MSIVLKRRTCPGLQENSFNPILKALSSKNEWPLFDLVTCQRLQAVRCRCRRGAFAFQLPKNV